MHSASIMLVGIVILVDWYFYRAMKYGVQNLQPTIRRTLGIIYWLFTIFSVIYVFVASYYVTHNIPPPKFAKVYIFGIILIILVSKLLGSIFIILDDIKSLILFISKLFTAKQDGLTEPTHQSITRKSFLKKSALVAAFIPFSTFLYGMFNTFDFKIRTLKLKIPSLPNSFKGLKIVQISDIHTGSFVSDEPLRKAVELIMEQNADVIFFTGDLVNDITEEALPFIDVLNKIKAPMGVFSILGNHDYGNYFYESDDLEGKEHNYKLMKKVHEKLGWKLLLNENHILEKNNDRLAIIGVENWGNGGRFPKFGDVKKACVGCLEEDVKLLLSHDPSHWESKVLPDHSDIAVTFSGHTHGMQFGIEIPGFKWSLSKYFYTYWAGHYQRGQQQIYVNRGLGFIGYPGRVGILPEITVFELS